MTAEMEWEPKTLSLKELKYAREAALYVLNTNTSEEAIRIFTEGLKPVLGIKNNSLAINPDDDEMDGSDFNTTHRGRTVKHDVVTAPF